MARKPPKGKSLVEVNPELAKQWHTSKNGDLTPFNVTTGSNKKVWWKCEKGDDHEWQAQITNRTNGTGCSICRGLKVVSSNCLATLNSKLAKEWHPTKNGNLTPFDVTSHSGKKVWWKCVKADDHEWKTSVHTRSSGKGCPVCGGRKIVKSNCLATLNLQLAKEWHPTKNGNLTPLDVTIASNKKVILTSEQIEKYGIDIQKYDERKLLDANNGRFILRFGDFYFYRVEDDLFRILTKKIK